MTIARQRIITGAAFGLIMVSCILLSQVTFIALFFSITFFTLLEFYRLVSTERIKPQIITGALISMSIFILSCCIFNPQFELNFFSDLIYIKALAFIFLLIFIIFIVELYRKTPEPFISIAFTFTGIIYVALPFSLMPAIAYYREGGYNPQIILGFFFLLWASDTGAYITGRKFGKHKLLERVSPKKTWEGSAGGAVAALMTAVIISLFFVQLPLCKWLIVSLIIVIAGTLGDLTESMLKRSLNIKDSGKLLPGHGGLLDRFDGLLGATPFVFFYLYFF